MFEFLTHGPNDAINLIIKDHENVKHLFDQFEKAESLREKRQIVADTILELKLHAAIEEEIFYAAVRPQIEKKTMNEADEEHHVAKLLIAELEYMDGTESHYDAKYKVLSENIRHHIREEEGDMLLKARALEIDFESMGIDIQARKNDLKKNGIPEFEEETVVGRGGVKDSPARIADDGRSKKPSKAKGKAAAVKSRKPATSPKSKKSAKIMKFPKTTKKVKKPNPAKKASVKNKMAKTKSAKLISTKVAPSLKNKNNTAASKKRVAKR